uniref:Kelch motif family protein n=1 Tax=Acrobeloides nanus TaxID=290746 RepID=A0A914DQX3_9BILA
MAMSSEGQLYLVGGVDYKCYLSDIWVIDTKDEKLEWKLVEQKCNLKGRYTHDAILIDEKILLFGGGDGDWSASFDKIDAFDLNSQKLIQIQTLPDENHGYPHPRKFHSSVKNGNHVYIIGGWSKNNITLINSEENATIYGDVWKLSLIINEDKKFYIWTRTLSNLKMPLFFHTSAITPEGCVYTFGGCIDAESMYPSNKLQRFWVQPPELKQIAAFKLLIKNTHLIEEFQKREVKRLREKMEEQHNTTNQLKNSMKENKSEENFQEGDIEEGLHEEIEQNLRELLQTKPSRMFCGY